MNLVLIERSKYFYLLLISQFLLSRMKDYDKFTRFQWFFVSVLDRYRDSSPSITRYWTESLEFSCFVFLLHFPLASSPPVCYSKPFLPTVHDTLVLIRPIDGILTYPFHYHVTVRTILDFPYSLWLQWLCAVVYVTFQNSHLGIKHNFPLSVQLIWNFQFILFLCRAWGLSVVWLTDPLTSPRQKEIPDCVGWTFFVLVWILRWL